MNLLNVSTTAIDLNGEVAPFTPNNTVLAYSVAGATLQESATEGSGYVTLATLVAGVFQKVTLTEQYVKVASGSAQLIGN
jgi:hypothetical protein